MPKENEYTGQDIWVRACGYLSQSESDMGELAQFAPGWLNALLAEALPYENARRVFEGNVARPPLVVAPVLKGLEDVVPYDDEICAIALPYGLASQLYLDDEEDYRAQDFRGRFVGALRDSQRVRGESIQDVY